jgi:RNA polymerase sigma factor (sigma-70 family)
MSAPPPTFARLLDRHRGLLVRWSQVHGAGLLRYESAEDLAQGATLRALQASARYVHRSEEGFVGWLVEIARAHVADRWDWWRARKRHAGRALRLALGSGTTSSDGAPEPASRRTGPTTFAGRRELLARAARALAAIGERDGELVRQQVEGVSVEETAARLGLSYAAAQRARLRALERLRKAALLAES